MKAFETTTVAKLLQNSTRIWITGPDYYKGAIDDLGKLIRNITDGLQLEVRAYQNDKPTWDQLWLRVDWLLIPENNNRQAVLLAVCPNSDMLGDNIAMHDFHIIIEASTGGKFNFVKNRLGYLYEGVSKAEVLDELERALTIPDVTPLQYAQGHIRGQWATFQFNRMAGQMRKRRKSKED